jgi:Zn-dependent peptidase ImmA (M78 family)
MIETYQRIDDRTMSSVREFAQQYGCSHEVALRYLLKIGRYPQGDDEDDEAYAARLDGLPDPEVKVYRGLRAANDD